MIQRERERQTDGQTGQTGQTDRQTESEGGKERGPGEIETERQRQRQTERGPGETETDRKSELYFTLRLVKKTQGHLSTPNLRANA